MAKPVVDGLEREMKEKVRFARVDIGSDEGGRLANQYGIAGVPAFVVLDENGRVIYRKIGGKPDVAQIKTQLGK
ncbi:MAG: thioredoxin family protein [Polyangiales bacterium]